MKNSVGNIEIAQKVLAIIITFYENKLQIVIIEYFPAHTLP